LLGNAGDLRRGDAFILKAALSSALSFQRQAPSVLARGFTAAGFFYQRR
jgi:hypothetical protein